MHKKLLRAADRSGDTQHEPRVERAAGLLCQRPGQVALETTSAAAEGTRGANTTGTGTSDDRRLHPGTAACNGLWINTRARWYPNYTLLLVMSVVLGLLRVARRAWVSLSWVLSQH